MQTQTLNITGSGLRGGAWVEGVGLKGGAWVPGADSVNFLQVVLVACGLPAVNVITCADVVVHVHYGEGHLHTYIHTCKLHVETLSTKH